MTETEIRGILLKLTELQLEVVRCKVAGMTYVQVGERLHIHPRTARRRTQTVLDALGTDSLIEAAVLLTEAGLLTREACPLMDKSCPL